MDDIEITKPKPDIDRVSQESGFSRPSGVITDMYRGLDHRGSGSSFQKNNDHQGLTLFTRPYLNLSYNNVLADRNLGALLDPSKKSKYRAIRSMLDPKGNHESDLFDTKQAFIPLLTNTLASLSGMPDITISAYTSPEGLRKESFSMVDDIAEINGTYDVTATFNNTIGDPITEMFHCWIKYQGNVYTDRMVPYPEMIVENRIDYQTRIWRLILDSTKRFVKRIGCTNASFPLADPLGAVFNWTNDRPYSEDNNQISIPFRCIGAEYDDPLLYLEFNDTVALFNPSMADGQRHSRYRQLKFSEMDIFNNHGYPWINVNTLELEWWIDPEEYELIMNELTGTVPSERQTNAQTTPVQSNVDEDYLNTRNFVR